VNDLRCFFLHHVVLVLAKVNTTVYDHPFFCSIWKKQGIYSCSESYTEVVFDFVKSISIWKIMTY
jgi:hypothetical protein